MVQGVTDNNVLQPFRHPDRNAFPENLDLAISFYWGDNRGERNAPHRGNNSQDRFLNRLQHFRGRDNQPQRNVVEMLEQNAAERQRGESSSQARKKPQKSSSREVIP